jgi:hypothetical protein
LKSHFILQNISHLNVEYIIQLFSVHANYTKMGETFVNRGQGKQPVIHLCQLTYDVYDSTGYKRRRVS